jgi:ubiquinone/menaquinone biosynthesis C-methylase UbiE
VKAREAAALIATAVAGRAGTWMDVGAGDGTFTRALVQLLGPQSQIYAVDADAKALARLGQWGSREGANVIPVVADFTRGFELPGLEQRRLDGILAANALHFVPDPARVLAQLVRRLRPGGRVVVIEYHRRRATRWVPYPIDKERLPDIAAEAGLTSPTIEGTRPSMYGGVLYVAAMELP